MPVECENDGSIQQPVIIAPTWHKSYSNPHIIRIWNKCEEILRNSEEIIFVGYSLPPADHELRYILKKNTYKTNVEDRPDIYLITKSENINNLKIVYKTMFGPDVKINNDGFENFANDPNIENLVFI